MTKFEEIKNMSVGEFLKNVLQREVEVADICDIYSFHNKGDGKSSCPNCIAKEYCKTSKCSCFEAMNCVLIGEKYARDFI